jgi:hypothetical protein
MYPEGLTRNIQIVLGLIVLVINVSVYAWLIKKRMERPKEKP